MSWLQANSGASGRTRRRITAVVIAGGLVLGATALAPTSGADEIGDKRAQAAKVADQLDALQSRQMDLSAQAERVTYEKHQAELAVADAQKLLDETNADLDLKRSLVRDAAVDAYQNGNDSPEFDAFLTSDANAGLQKRSYLETRTGDVKAKVDSLASTQQKAEDDKARLEDAQKAADAKAAEIAELKSASDKAVADQQALNAKVQGELSTLVQAEQQRRAAEAKAASDAAAARIAAAAPVATAPAAGGGGAPATPRAGAKTGTSPVVVDNPSPPAPGNKAQAAIAAALSKRWLPLRVGRRRSERVRLLRPRRLGLRPGRRRWPPALQRSPVRHDHPDLPQPAAARGPRLLGLRWLRARGHLHGRQLAGPRLRLRRRREHLTARRLVEAADGLRPPQLLSGFTYR